jgi:spore coat protein U-like protein
MTKLTNSAICLAITLCGSTVALPSVAVAATATTTFPVTATVIDSCTVSASPFAFGNYNGIASGMHDATGDISAICTVGTSYTVALDAGLGTGATQANRKLTGPASAELNYGLFTDAARSTIWGDNTGGTGWLVGSGSGVAQAATIYGRIPPGQPATVGSYSDTIMLTLSY